MARKFLNLTKRIERLESLTEPPSPENLRNLKDSELQEAMDKLLSKYVTPEELEVIHNMPDEEFIALLEESIREDELNSKAMSE